MFGLQGEAVNNCLKDIMYNKLKVISARYDYQL